MLKKYIIMAFTISNIGGGQIYSKNKYIYLKNKGWSVDIYSGYAGDSIMVDELKVFGENVITELQYYPFLFSRETLNRVINNIINYSLDNDNYEEIIIESHNIQAALWCELIAKRLRCKHIIFLLQESFVSQPSFILKYFDFKHKRKELAGINRKSLGLLFGNFKVLNENEKYFLKAMCTNSVENIDNPIIDKIEKLDINIGCISRLQKPFINTMINEIINFANKNCNKSILLVLVGGAPNTEIEQNIITKLNNIKNIKLVMIGRLYPIPRKLFQIIDVFIGVAGSARVSAYEGALTLALDVQSHKPIGVLGYDTQNSLYSTDEPKATISETLETLLIEQQLHKNKLENKLNLEVCEYEKEYDNHMEFIQSSSVVRDYYIISEKKIGIKNIIKKLFIKTMKIKRYEKLIQLIQRLKLYSLVKRFRRNK